MEKGGKSSLFCLEFLLILMGIQCIIDPWFMFSLLCFFVPENYEND